MWGIPEKNYQKLAQQCKLDHSNVLPAHEMTRSPFAGFSPIVIPLKTSSGMDSIVYGSINLKLCVMPYIAKIKNPFKGRVRNPKKKFLAQATVHGEHSVVLLMGYIFARS